jgi:hypothetical protein
MLSIPQCLDNRLANGRNVRITHRTRFTFQKYFFLLILIYVTDWVNPRALCGWKDCKKFNYLIRNRTRGLPACSITPQPLRYRVPLHRRSVSQKPVGGDWVKPRNRDPTNNSCQLFPAIINLKTSDILIGLGSRVTFQVRVHSSDVIWWGYSLLWYNPLGNVDGRWRRPVWWALLALGHACLPAVSRFSPPGLHHRTDRRT